jgi:RNA polymerase sigma factor (sigma-70 family)
MSEARSQECPDADSQWAAWMAAAQAGDRAAYDNLLRACIPLIKRVVRGQGVGRESLDDVVQETLLSIHRARHTYEFGRSITAWLIMIAQRRAIDALRRSRQRTREVYAPIAYENHADAGCDFDGKASELRQLAWLGAAICSLPVRQREAIDLLIFQSQSLAGAAAAAGRSTGSLRVSWHRAVRTLQARFQGEE